MKKIRVTEICLIGCLLMGGEAVAEHDILRMEFKNTYFALPLLAQGVLQFHWSLNEDRFFEFLSTRVNGWNEFGYDPLYGRNFIVVPQLGLDFWWPSFEIGNYFGPGFQNAYKENSGLFLFTTTMIFRDHPFEEDIAMKGVLQSDLILSETGVNWSLMARIFFSAPKTTSWLGISWMLNLDTRQEVANFIKERAFIGFDFYLNQKRTLVFSVLLGRELTGELPRELRDGVALECGLAYRK